MTHYFKPTLKPTLLALALAAVSGASFGQALPQAGQAPAGSGAVPSRQDASLLVMPPSLPAPAAAVAAVSVKVSGFRFVGNNSIRTEELQKLVADGVDKTLDLAGLDAVATKVSRYYRSKGYTVATAYLPPQQSVDGSIQIAVIEGQYANINLKNTSAISTPFLQRMVSANLCEGVRPADCKATIIEDIELERAVLLVKDLPGISAVSSLKPGDATGTSDLEIGVKDVRTKAYSMNIDNFGSKATGVMRYSFVADYNNPNDNGDQLSAALTTTGKLSNTGSLSYSLPIGYNGGRAGLSIARGHYRLGADFANLLSHGTSNTLSLYGTYPMVRTVNRSVYVRGSAEVRGLNSSIDSTSTSLRGNATILRTALSGDNVDSLAGGGYTVYGLGYSSGYIGVGDAVADATGARTAGRFTKISYNVARQQAISGPVTLYASLNGQQANKNLDPSEQIGIAGPQAVRAYSGEGGGSVGAVGTAELRYTTSLANVDGRSNLTYALFVDRGWMNVYQDTSILKRETRALTGYGLSATLQNAAYFVKASYGLHKATEPSKVDNSTRKVWVQGGLNF